MSATSREPITEIVAPAFEWIGRHHGTLGSICCRERCGKELQHVSKDGIGLDP